MSPVPLPRHCPPFLLRSRGNHKVELELIFGDRYVSLVEEGYDVAIRVGIPVDSALRSHALGEGRRRLVASPAYLERHGIPLTPRDLEQHQCLVHTERSTRAAWSFRKRKETHQVRVGGRISANHSESTLHMVKAGLGVALLASWLVDADIQDGRLVTLLGDYEPPTAPVRALTPTGRLLAPRVRALIEHLRRALSITLAEVTPEEADRRFRRKPITDSGEVDHRLADGRTWEQMEESEA